MFKKFVSLALIVMMLMSVAVVAVSAAQVEVADEAADAAVAEQGAESGDAATGALDKSKCLNFDNSVTNWAGAVKFYVYDAETGEELVAWGSKKLNGTDNGDGTWSYDPSDMGLVDGKQYALIFNDEISNAQTYDLLFDTGCIGDTAYCTGNDIENPVDSNKTAKETAWKSNTNYGAKLAVTSIGNVVGKTCPASTTPYKMLVDFLSKTLDNARTYSNKDDQTLLDDTAKALGIGKNDVEKAIAESGKTVDWSKDKSSLADDSDASANQSGTSGGGGSTATSSSSAASSSGSKTTTTTSTSSKSGSASNTQTGQTETVLFIMLAVMVAAAGVIFFARKRERA